MPLESGWEFWQWLSAYYCCTIGEVMNAALPSGLKLDSETQVILHPSFDGNMDDLTDKEYLIYEALTIQEELSIEQVQKILNIKTVRPMAESFVWPTRRFADLLVSGERGCDDPVSAALDFLGLEKTPAACP